MATRESKGVIYAAIFANIAIAVCKFAAAAVTHSSAMLAEALHSTADSGNELLLLWGIRRSARPPDALHPYGHGKALYFYSLLVAVYIFGLGGGLTIYRGISQLRRPEASTNISWSYSVLAFAVVCESVSWWFSYRALRLRKDPEESLIDRIVRSKDPTIFIVFVE